MSLGRHMNCQIELHSNKAFTIQRWEKTWCVSAGEVLATSGVSVVKFKTHSFNKYLFVSGAVLHAGHTEVSRQGDCSLVGTARQ